MWPSQGHGDSREEPAPEQSGAGIHSLATHIRRHHGDLVLVGRGWEPSAPPLALPRLIPAFAGMTGESPSPLRQAQGRLLGPGMGSRLHGKGRRDLGRGPPDHAHARRQHPVPDRKNTLTPLPIMPIPPIPIITVQTIPSAPQAWLFRPPLPRRALDGRGLRACPVLDTGVRVTPLPIMPITQIPPNHSSDNPS